MHPVHIGIRGNYNIVISKPFDAVFHIQCMLQKIEFFVFIHYFLSKSKAIQGFPRRLKTAWVSTFRTLVIDPLAESPSVINMVDFPFAFRGSGLFPFRLLLHCNGTGNLSVFYCADWLSWPFRWPVSYAGQFFSFLFTLFNPFLHCISDGGIFVEVIVQFPGEEIVNEIFHAGAAFFHILAAEFGLCLRFKNRFHYAYRNGGRNALPDIGSIIILFVKIAHHFHKGFAECLLVGATLCRKLAVYKTEYFFAIIVVMGDGYFDIVPLQVNDRITKFILIRLSF